MFSRQVRCKRSDCRGLLKQEPLHVANPLKRSEGMPGLEDGHSQKLHKSHPRADQGPPGPSRPARSLCGFPHRHPTAGLPGTIQQDWLASSTLKLEPCTLRAFKVGLTQQHTESFPTWQIRRSRTLRVQEKLPKSVPSFQRPERALPGSTGAPRDHLPGASRTCQVSTISLPLKLLRLPAPT